MVTTEIGKLLMFGDSITEFAFDQHDGTQFALGPALQNRYVRRLQVLHRGFSGYTSREGVKLCQFILKYEHDTKPEAQQIKLAYVFFGTNDARKQGTDPSNIQHIDKDQYVCNMVNIIKQFQDRNIPLIVVTPTVHDQKMWDVTHPQDLETGDFRSTELNKEYADALKEECKRLNVPVLDLLTLMTQYSKENGLTHFQNGQYDDFLADGVHFNGLAYQVMYDGLVSIIEKTWPHLEHMNISPQFPYRRNIVFESLDDLK